MFCLTQHPLTVRAGSMSVITIQSGILSHISRIVHATSIASARWRTGCLRGAHAVMLLQGCESQPPLGTPCSPQAGSAQWGKAAATAGASSCCTRLSLTPAPTTHPAPTPCKPTAPTIWVTGRHPSFTFASNPTSTIQFASHSSGDTNSQHCGECHLPTHSSSHSCRHPSCNSPGNSGITPCSGAVSCRPSCDRHTSCNVSSSLFTPFICALPSPTPYPPGSRGWACWWSCDSRSLTCGWVTHACHFASHQCCNPCGCWRGQCHVPSHWSGDPCGGIPGE